MKQTPVVLERLSSLIKNGGEVVGWGRSESANYYGAYHGWQAAAQVAIGDIAGVESAYYKSFETHTYDSGLSAASIGLSILEHLKRDVEAGYLRRTADLIAAEVFTDFIDMAEYLVEQGYYHPAASLAGAVLEDGLRRILTNAKGEVAPRNDISSLNSKCAEKGIYNRLVQKQVAVWGAVRNNADHGKWEDVKEPDVRDMVSGVGRFLAESLG